MLFNRMRWATLLIGALAFSTLPTRAATLLVPAYFDPNDHAAEWSQLTAAASKVPVTAIFNPNSGPGTAVDPAYTAVLSAFRAAGGKAVAYVHTQTSTGALRDLATVEGEIDSYRTFYKNFDGVFIDEMTSDKKSADITYYTNLYNYIKGKNADYTVIGNPGTNTFSNYTAAADVLVTYEDVAANYAANVPDAWTQSAASSGFAHIVYDAGVASLNATLQQAKSQNAGYVYVTDDGVDGNPYDSLPTYWTAEVNAVVPEPAIGGLAIAAVAMIGRRRHRSRKNASVTLEVA